MQRPLFITALLLPAVSPHAVLTEPVPRPNLELEPGVKLQPFSAARTLANSGCGGTANSDPGVRIPTRAYQPGQPLLVQWKLTIPHPIDVVDSGVRIALHYGPGDSFNRNILAGGVVGDPQFIPVPAGPAGAPPSLRCIAPVRVM